ncbi:E3 binding domain-containing protein [Streptomyces sp. NPDC006617]|uniref:E3 binding domain-containing protein n=1 Tax=Streptomyces sp. NPDC006617 TaxID=3155354 RepID=UPI0033BA5DEC
MHTPRNTAAVSRPLLSPRVRRLARDHGVDLSRVDATGPGGRLTAADVTTWLAHQDHSAGPGRTEASSPALAVAWADVDLHRVAASAQRQTGTAETGAIAHICAAVAAALRSHPLAGTAGPVDLLVERDQAGEAHAAAAIRRADEQPVETIATILARPTEPMPDQIGFIVRWTASPVLTTSDLVPGQDAALCLGPAARKVVVVDGPEAEGMAVHPVATFVLTTRRDAVDTSQAVAFLTAVKATLEHQPTPDSSSANTSARP